MQLQGSTKQRSYVMSLEFDLHGVGHNLGGKKAHQAEAMMQIVSMWDYYTDDSQAYISSKMNTYTVKIAPPLVC